MNAESTHLAAAGYYRIKTVMQTSSIYSRHPHALGLDIFHNGVLKVDAYQGTRNHVEYEAHELEWIVLAKKGDRLYAGRHVYGYVNVEDAGGTNRNNILIHMIAAKSDSQTSVTMATTDRPNAWMSSSRINPMKMDRLMLNVKGGYSASSGKFTAPTSGIYRIFQMMQTTYTSRGHTHAMGMAMYKNGATIGDQYQGQNRDEASMYHVHEMERMTYAARGNQLWVDFYMGGRSLIEYRGGTWRCNQQFYLVGDSTNKRAKVVQVGAYWGNSGNRGLSLNPIKCETRTSVPICHAAHRQSASSACTELGEQLRACSSF